MRKTCRPNNFEDILLFGRCMTPPGGSGDQHAKNRKRLFSKYFFATKKKTSSKNFFLSNILFMKYSDLNFCWNRSSRTQFARAIWRHANRPKMSPGMSCSNVADHIRMFIFDSNSDQKMVCEFTTIEKEFELHIWGIQSPHEYYKIGEFQLQTPTRSGRTKKSCNSQVVRFGNQK